MNPQKPTLSDSRFYRTGGVAAIAGVVILLAATVAHPMDADPADAVAAFTEYATDPSNPNDQSVPPP